MVTPGAASPASCPACLSTQLAPYLAERWTIDGAEYRLERCGSCGCAFTFPPPGDAALEKLYRTSFDYRWYEDHYQAKLCDCRTRVQEYRAQLGERVLDFGGGVGYFSKAASEVGLRSVTYDPFADAAAAPPARHAWDCVVALHVLEHSNDLDRTLSGIKDFLVAGGRIILAVPNFDGLGYRSQGMRWVWAQPPLVHIFHFTAAGLRALLTRHGFGEPQVSYHERWDANNVADVDEAERFRALDAEWGRRYLNRSALYRRWIARRNSRRRFDALERALARPAADAKERSELQVVATLRDR